MTEGSTAWYFGEDVPGKSGWLIDMTRCTDDRTSRSSCKENPPSLVFRLPRPEQHGQASAVAVVTLELEYLLRQKAAVDR